MKTPNGLTSQGSPDITDSKSVCVHSLYKHIPNSLTILRLLGTPVVLWAVTKQHHVLALLLFFMISITDYLDGYLARRWSASSHIGQILDPLADKFLITSVYLILGLWGYVPIWLASLVIARDILIILIGSMMILARRGTIRLPPQFIGKICTALQMLFVGFLLIQGVFNSSIPPSSIQSILMVSFAYVVALTTAVSGMTYATVVVKLFLNRN